MKFDFAIRKIKMSLFSFKSGKTIPREPTFSDMEVIAEHSPILKLDSHCSQIRIYGGSNSSQARVYIDNGLLVIYQRGISSLVKKVKGVTKKIVLPEPGRSSNDLLVFDQDLNAYGEKICGLSIVNIN